MLLFAIFLTLLNVNISCLFGWNSDNEPEHTVKLIIVNLGEN